MSLLWKVLAGYESDAKLSYNAQKMVNNSFIGVTRVVDNHMHVLGLGSDASGCFVHKDVLTSWDPRVFVKTNVMLSCCGIEDVRKSPDKAVAGKLNRLIREFPRVPYHGLVFAFAATHSKETGEMLKDKTGMYVPNKYVVDLCKQQEEEKEGANLVPVGSIHPYQNDLVEQFDYLAANGVTVLKLLPNSMGLDPSDSKVERFVQYSVKHNMTVIVHVGHEHSVSAGGICNAYGNPMLWKRWLDRYKKFRIVFAHVGSEGSSRVLGKDVTNFDLVLNLLRNYKGQAFADISAFACAPLRTAYLKQLLMTPDVHSQLFFGSDYPLPSTRIAAHVTTLNMYWYGLISWKTKNILMEIHGKNALLFNFVAMRQVSYNGAKFPSNLFEKSIVDVVDI